MIKVSLKKAKNILKSKKILLFLLLIMIVFAAAVGSFFVWKMEHTLNKISTKGDSFQLLWHQMPWVDSTIDGEKEGRINILLLGMRGADDPAGGLLSDSQMVISLDLKDNKIAMVSVPRDLYVDNPTTGGKTKLNAVYAEAETASKGQGIAVAKNKFSEITGLTINYTVVVNQQAFKDVINSLGGIELTLDSTFSESKQFMGIPQICNNSSYTVPTGKYKTQRIKYYSKNGALKRVKLRKAQLCYPTVPPECGGNFTLESGKHILSGDQALCFVRSRDMTNDFERAKRQQLILQQIKNKALELGTLANISKMNSLLDSLGNNILIDMKPWEMKRLWDLGIKINKNNPQILQHTLEDSPEGMLYWPGNLEGVGYILLPRGNSYNDIQNLFKNVFNLPSQSDANAKL